MLGLEKNYIIGITFFATLFIIAIGVIMIFITPYYYTDPLLKDIFKSVGITLISAGTIGVITEIFLMMIVTTKILKLESKFLQNAIPQIIQTVNDWIQKEGKSIPIDKSSLYGLIRIGYSQWFMQEDFEKIFIPSSKVAKLYQDIQLGEFKEPVILDFSCIMNYKGKNDSKIIKKNNLINILITTKFVAVNTANENSIEKRYINKNGLLNHFSFDIYGKLPHETEEKKKYIENIKQTLKIQHGESHTDFSLEPIEINLEFFTRTIEKKTQDIIEIIQSKTNHQIKKKQAFLMYQFQGDDSNQSSKLSCAIFCPYALKPQERIIVSHTRIMPFAENDFLSTSMKSLTRGLTFQLDGFNDFTTSITEHLLNNERDSIIHTKTMLSTSSLMLPRSLVLVSWQKNKNI